MEREYTSISIFPDISQTTHEETKMKKVFSVYAGLPSSIYILFAARVINSMGSFVFPFLTLFLTKKMGMSEGEVGFFVMMSSIAGVPGNLLGGAIADRFGRKWVFITVQFLSALCLIVSAFAGLSLLVPWLLIASLFFSNAARPVNSAMIADMTSGEQRKRAFSLLYLGINIGFSIGPIISGFLFNKYIMWIFLGDALTTLLSLIPVAMFVKETKPTLSVSKENACAIAPVCDDGEAAYTGSTLSALFKRPILLMFCGICAIITFVYAQHTFSLPMFMDHIFGEQGASHFGILMTTNGLVVVFLTTIIITVTHRFKPIVNSAIAGLFYAIGFGMLYFIRSLPLFIVSTAIWTIGEILVTTNNSVYIAQHTPSSHRGRFNAVLPFISGSGFTLGPVIMGQLIPVWGLRNVWTTCFILSVLSTGLMFLLFLYEERGQRGNDIGKFAA